MTGLRVEGVYKVFGRRPGEAVKRLRDGASRDDVRPWGTAAVIDADLEIRAGETFVVMGLSGSGKSTLIRMLNGLLTPTAGRVLLDDDDLGAVSPAQLRSIRQRKVSMVFQHFALLPHRTVRDNAAYPLALQGVDRDESRTRADEALAMVGLDQWGDSLPHELSGGMRQRVGLARALAADTDVLLMDEAFSALDPLIRREMQDQLLELQQSLGKTIVFITHDLNEAMYLGDRIAMMRDGRVVQVGTSEQILSSPADDYVAQFIADVDRTRVLTASSVMRRPAAVAFAAGGPRLALRTMRDAQVAAAYVVDRSRVLHGIVRDADAVEATRAGRETLDGLVDTSLTSVSVDTPLADVFAPAAESPLPVPVTDDKGRLVGVIPRATLLEAMVPADTGTPPRGTPTADQRQAAPGDADAPDALDAPADPDAPADATTAAPSAGRHDDTEVPA